MNAIVPRSAAVLRRDGELGRVMRLSAAERERYDRLWVAIGPPCSCRRQPSRPLAGGIG